MSLRSRARSDCLFAASNPIDSNRRLHLSDLDPMSEGPSQARSSEAILRRGLGAFSVATQTIHPDQASAGLSIRGAAIMLAALLSGCSALAPKPEPAPAAAPPAAEAFALPQGHFSDPQAISLREKQRADAIARLELVIDEDDALRGTDPGLPGRRFDNLWDRIRAGFAMPELNSPLVGQKERFYLERRDYMQRMMQRGGRYLFHIVEEIEKRNMPTELALLPFVESAMNPTAVSTAQASGLWQFIPSTGRAFNLQQDWWVDNRRDVVKSTQAALDYLQKIYEMQGRDWFLALASYNWGEGAVARAMRNNQARNRPTDYLSLNMPNETRQYVPKLIALKNILMRADELGLALPPLPNRPFFVTIEKTRPIDLSLAAEFAAMSVEEFLELNPAHNRPVIAATRNNEIKLPADRLDGFLEAVERHIASGKPFATWQPYTLKANETLELVAARNGIAPADLRRANGVRANTKVIGGTRLLVPNQPVVDDRRVEDFQGPRIVELAEQRPVYHAVGANENFAAIARRHRVTVAQLRKLNPSIEGEPARGTRLLIRPGGPQTIVTTENGRREVTEAPRPVAAATPAQPGTPPPPASAAQTTQSAAPSTPAAATASKPQESAPRQPPAAASPATPVPQKPQATAPLQPTATTTPVQPAAGKPQGSEPRQPTAAASQSAAPQQAAPQQAAPQKAAPQPAASTTASQPGQAPAAAQGSAAKPSATAAPTTPPSPRRASTAPAPAETPAEPPKRNPDRST